MAPSDAQQLLATLRLDRSSPVPLYFQVAEALEKAITEGVLPPGTRLDNEILLAEPTFRLVRESVEAELLASADLKGKREPVAVYRLLSIGQRSELAPRLEAPLVGRRDALAQLEWALERTVRERGCRLVTVVGALLIGVLRNGLVLLNVSPFIQQIVIGLVLVAAVAFDQYAAARRRA